jgi:hypothetical protein
MHFSTAVETVIAGGATPVKALGTTTAGALQDFTAVSNNRLRYDGAQTAQFLVTAAVSMTSVENTQLVGVSIAKTGVQVAASEIFRKHGGGADTAASAVVASVTLATTNYIELWVSNETSTGNIEVEQANITVVEVS